MEPDHPHIFILSGGVGSSGGQLVNTVLAQFPKANVQVTVLGNVRQTGQVHELLERAKAAGGLVVHTLVEDSLRQELVHEAERLGVPALDLTGPLIGWLSQELGQQPLGKPGLYRQLRRQYFDRVAAIDYTLAHDDGKDPDGWAQADLVLVGVSRAGKTPLSIYLAVLGWKVANYPIVPGIPVPDALFELEPQRVVGLKIDLAQLLSYRIQRQAHLGTSGLSGYVDPDEVKEELREAVKVFRRGGFQVLDMTDKTIEMAADEVQRRVSPR